MCTEKEKLHQLIKQFLSELDLLPDAKGADLAKYLRTTYFTLERIKKWSLAYRPKGWKLNHTMHLESWHKKLKYFWMAGKGNKRMDTCILVLWVSNILSLVRLKYACLL